MSKYSLIGPADESTSNAPRKSKYSLITEESQEKINKPKSFMDRVEDFNNFMGRYAAPVAAGVIQGPLDLANLGGNVLRGAVGMKQIPRTDLSEYLPSGHSEVGKLIGEYGTLAPVGASLGKAALRNIGITDAASKLGSKLGRSLSQEKMGEALLGKYKTNLEGARREFGHVFEEAKKHGAPNIDLKIPKRDLIKLKKAVGAETIEEFMSHPTAEGAHYLRSALRKYEEGIKNLGHASHPSDRILARKAGEYSKRLGESLKESLGKANPELPEMYSSARAGYKANVAPFQNVRGNYFGRSMLKPGEKGYLNPNRLPGKTLKESGDPVRQMLEKEMPELGWYEKLHPSIGKLATGSVGGYLGYGMLKKLLGIPHN